MTARLRAALVWVSAVLGALIVLGAVGNLADGVPGAGNALVIGLVLLLLGTGLRARRNLHRMAEHRALAARADAALR